MGTVIGSVLKAAQQLFDPAIVRVLAKSLAITVAIFAILGVILFLALSAALSSFGWEESGVASAAFALILAAIGFWFLFRVVALAVIQFFADEIITAVEARHYPEAAHLTRSLSMQEEVATAVRTTIRAVIYNLVALPIAVLLIFTAIGPAVVFVLVNAVLLGRELTDMTWVRFGEDGVAKTPVNGVDRFMLGGIVAGMMLVPGLGLLAPVIGTAAGTHVTHRAMADREHETGAGE